MHCIHKHQRCRSDCMTLCLLPLIELPGSVHDFRITPKGAHVLTFSWQPPSRNSAYTSLNYTLVCNPESPRLPHTFTNQSVDAGISESFEDLQADTEYECSVITSHNDLLGPGVTQRGRTLGRLCM